MSTTYKTIAGDTFETIARKTYGDEKQAFRVMRANPGSLEPLSEGVVLIIPDIADAPKNIQQSTDSTNENETALLIDGVRFRFWDKIKITRSMDSIDVVEFSAPFDSNNPEMRKTFKPFSYKSIVVTVGDNPVFTGVMVEVNPLLENERKSLTVSGYSSPGVLNDCMAPASSFPLEFTGLGLKNIVSELIEPFGISAIFESDQGAIFEQVATKASQKILDFIIQLSSQRNLIVSSSIKGQLILSKSIRLGTPVAILRQGLTPLMSVTPLFNPQNYFSHVTGLNQTVVGLGGTQFTVKNSHLTNAIRPFTFVVPDADNADMKQTVEAKTGRMFGTIVSYSVRVNTWRDANGNLWSPNTIVTLNAPDAMIYTNYKFIVRSVIFEKDDKTETATINLILPGSFSGEIPQSLPWDE